MMDSTLGAAMCNHGRAPSWQAPRIAMSETTKPLHAIVYGEWHYYAGFVEWSLKQKKIGYRAGPEAHSYTITTLIGRIRFTFERDKTIIQIDNIDPSAAQQWANLLNNMKQLAEHTREARHMAFGRTYEEAVEGFYRSKARGTKISLRQVATATGLNYGYLREKKAEYDRLGGWGAKPPTNEPTNDT